MTGRTENGRFRNAAHDGHAQDLSVPTSYVQTVADLTLKNVSLQAKEPAEP